jgi:GNAT superfamily N-acetyltransferase
MVEPLLIELPLGSAADKARLLAAGAHWGGALSPAQYAARDEHVAAHSAWMRSPGAYTVYALAAPNEAPLAYCDTFEMRALCCEEEGIAAPCAVLGIASVFTPTQHRRQGHASRMLTQLAASVRQRGKAVALLLMCEIAPEIYARCGYVAPEAAPAADWAFSAEVTSVAPPARTSSVLQADLPALAARCAELAQRDLLSQRVVGAITVTPTADQLRWHMARYVGRRHAQGLSPCASEEEACGAACGDAFAVWALDAEESTPGVHTLVLRILALCASADAEATAAVLAAAVAAALRAGAPLGRTVAWDTGTLQARSAAAGTTRWAPPAEQLARWGVASVHEARCCESVPMMAPLRPHVLPATWTWVPRGVWV